MLRTHCQSKRLRGSSASENVTKSDIIAVLFTPKAIVV